MSDVLYFNGRFTTTDERVIGVEDRGFQFGDSVYEVFRFIDRRPAFLHDHFRRLLRGLRAIEIEPPWSESSFAGSMGELLSRTAFEDGIVYIQITRGECERIHIYPEGLTPTVLAYSRRFRFPDAARKEQGIRLVTMPDIRWRHCDVKSVNLLANALAKKSAQRAGADEALLLRDGLVREGSTSNFFIVKKDRIITHPLDDHILPGIVRDHAIAIALEQRIRVDERPIREPELFDADEAFITSTTQGVMPVNTIDERGVAKRRRGEITTQLQRLFDERERQSMAGV